MNNNAQQQPAQQQPVQQQPAPAVQQPVISPVKLVPTKIFFTKGVGTHREELRSYELALRDAGIEKCNIVQVSSIFPPGCKIISRNEGMKELVPGLITYCVLARCSSNESRRLIAASVGSAIPAGDSAYGYLSEHHAYGQTDETAGDYAEELAARMLSSTLGLSDFDDSKDWDEVKKEYKISDKIVKTGNITQSTIVDPAGNWSTVVAAAVFLF
ncbi:MAG: arginine decarboxylase, pyruvoyl-dependent [Candidatus Gorgyraea atricola]|nr:arginine decarboxylase, pyruvoyl-dependent [Candidatus Gorgyraea atricola]